MKIKLTYYFIICLSFYNKAQQIKLNFEKGKCIYFKSNIYAFGFKTGSFCISKFDHKLKLIDSAFYILPYKSKSTDFLEIEADTLHQMLNFTLLKKDKLTAVLVKYDQQLKLIHEYKKVEFTKLDPLANFNQQKLFFKNVCYVIKSINDTSGKQFYRSKFLLNPSIEKPFNYQLKWQFNFDKKFIQNIHLFYADLHAI